MPLPPNFFYVTPQKRPATPEQFESNAIHLERAINNLPIFYPQRFRDDSPTPQTLSGSSSYTSIMDLNVNKLLDETTLLVEVFAYVTKSTSSGIVRIGFSHNSGTAWTEVTKFSVSVGEYPISGFVDVTGIPRGNYPLSKLGLRSSTSSVSISSSDTLCVKVTEIPPNT
jgi:hypothetical protein